MTFFYNPEAYKAALIDCLRASPTGSTLRLSPADWNVVADTLMNAGAVIAEAPEGIGSQERVITHLEISLKTAFENIVLQKLQDNDSSELASQFNNIVALVAEKVAAEVSTRAAVTKITAPYFAIDPRYEA